jgi:hypothetical protein
MMRSAARRRINPIVVPRGKRSLPAPPAKHVRVNVMLATQHVAHLQSLGRRKASAYIRRLIDADLASRALHTDIAPPTVCG